MIHQKSARLLPQHIQTKPQNQVRPSLSLGAWSSPLSRLPPVIVIFLVGRSVQVFSSSFLLIFLSVFPRYGFVCFSLPPALSFSLPSNRTKICPAGGERREKGKTSEKTMGEFNDRQSNELVFPRETVLVVKETSAKK